MLAEDPRRPTSLRELLDDVRERNAQLGHSSSPGNLDALFDLQGVDTQLLGRIVLPMLKGIVAGKSAAGGTQGLWKLPLFHKCLRKSVLKDPELELMLVSSRRALLERAAGGAEFEDFDFQLLVSIACQCFNNEYVYATTAGEEQQVASLASRLRQQVATLGESPSAPEVLAFAMYAPLWVLGISDELLALAALRSRQGVNEVFTRQLEDYKEERAIMQTLESYELGADQVTRSVQRQYEQSPYPRWFTITLQRQRPLAEVVSEILGRPFATGRTLNVLVAGCGTGREPISIASKYSDVSVVAIDVSRESLAFGVRQARSYGLSNIRFVQANLLRVEALETQFDVVFSTGVLHHMASPSLGLEALARVTTPGGVLKLGLYSQRARRRLRPFQALAHAEGSAGGGTDHLRRLRVRLLDGQLPDTAGLLRSPDFYYTSGVRDLLDHVHEVQFTPASLSDLLEHCGLRFLGFTNVSPGRCDGYRSRVPDDQRLTNLQAIDTYESEHPDMFRSLMSFWAEKPVS